jgi:2-polyprenyl-6-methoxyphenol hydroxylase-like FAD-dependent oxidoreductase
MAAELARYRVPVRIIDRTSSRTDKSKALAVWARTLELLDRAGAADAFAAAGLKTKVVSIRSGEQTIARVTFDAVASPFQYLLMIPQSESERLLETHLNALGVAVERDVELTGFADSGESVACTIRHRDGGVEAIEAGWLIGCDGAHSIVRKTLGIPFEGETLETCFILADVHVAGLEAGTELELFWHQDGIVVFFPISPGRYRIVADGGAPDRRDPTFDEVQAIVDQRGPGGVTLSDPIWLSCFAVNERKVKDFRADRIFLAGDAAHVHSPAGGQSMNTGMHDAFNLAWKLALTERGLANQSLLDSYSVERSAVAERILTDSGRLLRVATVRSRLAQDVRNFVAHRILGFVDIQHALAERLSETTIGYPNSPVNHGSAHGLRGPEPGQRILSGPPFGKGDTPRFALMATVNDEARSALRDYASLLEPELRAPPSESGVWLARPDGYVAAAARTGEWRIIRDCLARIAADAPQAPQH